ncbi:MAG: aspartate--tRNA ligase [Parcubacteria group bacterium]|nr:aspartate--tRNA ligase [Parcubacteria group bacterium]
MYRTHTCGELRAQDKGKEVKLAGWVNARRDHGGVIFIDLRDRYGLTQVAFDPKRSKDAWKIADSVRPEYVVQVTGTVRHRPKGMVNKKIDTGEVEVDGNGIDVLHKAKTPPFEINTDEEVNEDVRLEYRYLDLRGERMKNNVIARAKIAKFIRNFLDERDFVEIETPILTKSTPEGARDFIVPSRQQPGKFYALPQSPQQYKQLLMVAGMDRYYQLPRCFRDEDHRGDRQAEFTQLDLEMSFVERDDVLNLAEELFTSLVTKLYPHKKLLKKPWPRLSYDEVVLTYGTDRPDLRFGLEIVELSDEARGGGFAVFDDALSHGGVVRAIAATGAASFSRSQIDELSEYVKEFGAKGLAYIVVEEKGLKSPILKFLGEERAKSIVKKTGAAPGDIVFFGAGPEGVVRESMGELRTELGRRLNLIDRNLLAAAFIIDFPLFEERKEDGHYAPSHHMFTAPRPEDIKLLDSDPHKVRSWQYDMVWNGYEVGGGSIRIHDAEVQQKIFDLIGFSEERTNEFSHMLRAFDFGAPPHGGIAPGLDRIVMILQDEPNIREVIPFPKNQRSEDRMMGAPSPVEPTQLKEAHIKVVKEA